jgi:hypothetical protein
MRSSCPIVTSIDLTFFLDGNRNNLIQIFDTPLLRQYLFE